MTDLGVRTTELAGVVVATPVGRLDLSSYPSLRDDLLKLVAEAPVAVVVRLGPGFEVASRAMLAVFTAVWMKADQWPGVPVVLVAETDRHRHELARGGISRRIATAADLDSALERAAEPPLRRYRRRSLPNSLVAALLAREEVRTACEEWDLPALLDDALLVATELVENAVRHARTESVLRLELRAGGLSVAVRDGDPEPPVLTASRPGAPGHRGLELVQGRSVVWGTRPSFDGGKIVWAVLASRPKR